MPGMSATPVALVVGVRPHSGQTPSYSRASVGRSVVAATKPARYALRSTAIRTASRSAS
jgi:hypothetical protein